MSDVSPWARSHRFDRRALPLADRHYNREKVGTPQFVAPGRCVVLLTPDADALWVSSWQRPELVKHAWPGAWLCTLFRNESPMLASDLIRAAVAVTRYVWGNPPRNGMITFVDADSVKRKRDPGRCFLRAGFVPADPPRTKTRGYLAFQLWPDAMPAPAPPRDEPLSLFAG